ncbi:hypothetical protein LEP1GSC043_4808 [Leptospira weilii str. Ecochallenge]|uniref:Uncharacterized protein n=1 Tax=Leptospira weilii str. Ecochallenge TaxID=1049986 RepID=N1U3K9_9LEPT|nr:hypothetical protein LEP1GSC043_4808 [Leptospira weilii str. Ecochallenge]
MEELIFLHQKEKENQIYSSIFSFVRKGMRLLRLPFVSVDRNFELLTLGIQTYYTSLKTIEIERNYSPSEKEDIFLKHQLTMEWSELKNGITFLADFSYKKSAL